MNEDLRCCGSGTCIIDTDGRCWCGQRWDGNRLVGPGEPCPAPAPAQSTDSQQDTVRDVRP